jgi:hypothetical protein
MTLKSHLLEFGLVLTGSKKNLDVELNVEREVDESGSIGTVSSNTFLSSIFYLNEVKQKKHFYSSRTGDPGTSRAASLLKLLHGKVAALGLISHSTSI